MAQKHVNCHMPFSVIERL